MPSPKFQTYNLREIYHELGKYDFKIVLNPKFYKAAHDIRVQAYDSSGTPLKYEFNVWGRKINVSFVVDNTVADGVAYADIFRGDSKLVRLNWWVIKP